MSHISPSIRASETCETTSNKSLLFLLLKELPFCQAIPNNLGVGDEVVVRGKVKKHAER